MPHRIKALSDEFELVGEGGLDERRRFSMTKVMAMLKDRVGELGGQLDALHFQVYINSAGQILLDPALTVPLREMWLYRNPTALAKVREGLAQAAEGKLYDLGSFKKYAEDDID
jgi:hypothetical protein